MTSRLGHKQLAMLHMLAGPGIVLVVAGKLSRSLCARGLAHEMIDGGCVHITPAGLRALADAAEAGRIRLGQKLSEPRP